MMNDWICLHVNTSYVSQRPKLFFYIFFFHFSQLYFCLFVVFMYQTSFEVTLNIQVETYHQHLFYYVFIFVIMQIWKKFEQVGQEMVGLASSLSVISRASCQKQVSC